MKTLKNLFYLVIACLFITSCDSVKIDHKNQELPQFYVIGISVRTTNEGAKSQKDIGDLFTKFMIENTKAKIPGRLSDETYCVYTDYESDFQGPYTCILGCKVKSLDSIPAGMTGKAIPAAKYNVYTSSGKLPDCVINTWVGIWKSAPDRKYTADFDVYGDKAQNPANAEVQTFVSVK
ncbi:MAG TPA: GyrI-like domain-containing protein [Bacteroidia bacterium]|jgi:predicted transcriptional regulator YdeE|nr:GyrI-like domain-containing protein [Bacteroidia bacterium]